MAFSMIRLGSITLAGALALAACGSDATVDASKDTLAGSTETTAAPTTEAPTTTVEETTTTEASTTTTEAPTTTAAPVIEAPAGSVAFDTPEYTLQIGSDWSDATAELGGITGWFTGEATVDFAENVNILTDTIPDGTPLSIVLSASAGQIEAQFEGFNLLVSEVVQRPGQPEVGVLEYTALQEGTEVRFLQVFGIWNETLVVFTGSTDGREGADGADRLRPYALTLAPPS